MSSVIKSTLALRNIGSTIFSVGKCSLRQNAGCLKSISVKTHQGALIQSRQYSSTYFTKKHEYIILESDSIGRVGISDYAQEKLGDVVYVQLPDVGRDVEKDEEVAAVESVKAASEIYSPASGSITEVNETLESDCGLINKSALDQGWIFKLNVSNRDELKSLMSQADYEKYLEEEGDSDDH